jgi:hypothetical protein
MNLFVIMVGKQQMKKKSKFQKSGNISKKIHYICRECAEFLYPDWVLTSKNLIGCTMHEGKCDICGKEKMLTPVRDYLYVIGEETGKERKLWD